MGATRHRGFEAASGPLATRVSAGLAKIGLALKHRAWVHAGSRALTPTQAQILAALAAAVSPPGLRELAERLGITAPTASEAIAALVRKGLVRKAVAAGDARRRRFLLTAAGRRVARQVGDWPDFLAAGVEVLTGQEQAALLRALVKIIRTLQTRGAIPVSRMCVTCRYFQPHVHDDPRRPHHCAFVDAPFGDRHLRLDCPDHQPADADAQARAWARFAATPP
ncbi:MAG: MarR family winged helix-turn-helix transcriptional regulator [Firmicutes bacterium]|nr:MarR family winged helix-turn-helix transcriptional regulator [Bacillota bacterium]